MSIDERSIIDIDDLKLDKEVLRQPRDMRKAGRLLAKARLAHAEAEAQLDLVAADLSHKIRVDPESFGLEGTPSIPVVKDAVTRHKKYRTAQEAVRQAKYNLDNIDAFVKAMHHRKTMLELRVQLLGLEYYAEPSDKKMGDAGKQITRRSVRKTLKRSYDRDDDDD